MTEESALCQHVYEDTDEQCPMLATHGAYCAEHALEEDAPDN